MSIPQIRGVRLGGAATLPLLVCGPSLGTSASALWSSTAALLADEFHVVAWDLPGHGVNRTACPDGFTIGELAEGVLRFVDGVQDERDDRGATFRYAGVSVGGAVGQQLALDHADRLDAVLLACTAARFGEPQGWHERAALVRTSGTAAMVEASARRWFAPGFLERQPSQAGALLHSLRDTDSAGYAAVCEALATFDLRDRLHQLRTPVTALAGAYDQSAPVAAVAELAHGVVRGRLVVLERVGHLAPAEAPQETARAVRDAGEPAAPTVADRAAAGLAVRRAVLGPAYVDRATAAATELTRDFQTFITDYAWGGVWTRPGLDRASRSIITLTALVAGGHLDELALHLRAARTNGLSDEQIREVLLQTAIYCGVPAANSAFRVAQRVLAEPVDGDDEGGRK
jgi:3-oxoadipate enol-lactonase/4-carboxymuconolactone decarboxylase